MAAGFNTVYYSISWNNLEPTAPTVDAPGALVHAWNTAWLAALHASVSQFSGAGLRVISFIYALDAFHGGYPEAQRTDPTWQADTRSALAFAKANDVGWNFWALWPGAGSSLYVNTYHPEAKPDLLAVKASGF